ncbi:ATP-binding protein [Actinomadura sp. NPDC023710]|uniref:ATP-dependent nuclease n=1 Tax=Actinomadura sp. NPDC023710 TaxID=3158219 RepID=UPI0033D4C668
MKGIKDVMGSKIAITKLYFNNGDIVDIPQDGVTVFVGPNNSGKSFSLFNIINSARGVNFYYGKSEPIVKDVEISKSPEDVRPFLAWLEDSGWRPIRNSSGEAVYGASGNNGGVRETYISHSWQAAAKLGDLAQFILRYENTQGRLSLISGEQMIDPMTSVPGGPVQLMASDSKFTAKLSAMTLRAFGDEVCINTVVPTLELRLGKVEPYFEEGQIPLEVHKQYDALPLVREQGDGLRSFIGLLLSTVVRPLPITVIDEPEAFLHPSQARRLGRILVDETPVNSQLIVATHSQDLLQGILEATNRSVSIIRLTRDEHRGFRHDVLDANRISEIWKNPLLKYSSIIDGLFHHGVVIAEGDSDCRFYTATLDKMSDVDRDLDLLFAHLGGKGRIYKGISELRGLKVRVAAIADLDLLNQRGLLRRTIDAAGGSWMEIEKDHEVLSRSVLRLSPEAPKVSDVIQTIDSMEVDGSGEAVLTNQEIDRIKASLRGVSAWGILKKEGLDCLDVEGKTVGERIVRELEKCGVFLVPQGELESWLPLKVSKENWLSHVFENGLHEVPSGPLADFLMRVVRYFDT